MFGLLLQYLSFANGIGGLGIFLTRGFVVKQSV